MLPCLLLFKYYGVLHFVSIFKNNVILNVTLFKGYQMLLRELRSSSRARVAAMLPVCTMYDHQDRYTA